MNYILITFSQMPQTMGTFIGHRRRTRSMRNVMHVEKTPTIRLE